MPPKDYDATNVDDTNVEATNVDAMYNAIYDNIPNSDNDEMIVLYLQILLRHYFMMLNTEKCLIVNVFYWFHKSKLILIPVSCFQIYNIQ